MNEFAAPASHSRPIIPAVFFTLHVSLLGVDTVTNCAIRFTHTIHSFSLIHLPLPYIH